MKKLIAIVLCVILTLTMAGCGTKGTPPEEAPKGRQAGDCHQPRLPAL